MVEAEDIAKIINQAYALMKEGGLFIRRLCQTFLEGESTQMNKYRSHPERVAATWDWLSGWRHIHCSGRMANGIFDLCAPTERITKGD